MIILQPVLSRSTPSRLLTAFILCLSLTEQSPVMLFTFMMTIFSVTSAMLIDLSIAEDHHNITSPTEDKVIPFVRCPGGYKFRSVRRIRQPFSHASDQLKSWAGAGCDPYMHYSDHALYKHGMSSSRLESVMLELTRLAFRFVHLLLTDCTILNPEEKCVDFDGNYVMLLYMTSCHCPPPNSRMVDENDGVPCKYSD